MAYSVTDLRTRTRVTQTAVSVTGDADILFEPIMNTFTNTKSSETELSCSFYTIQFTSQVAGKLYVVKTDSFEEYLTSPDTNWPAKMPILVTYALAKDDSFNLRFTGSGTVSTIIITEHGGVY